ncbi:MAG: SDR family NAD(P)-dependent oxidoreductase [Marinilabiliaceae bacterium]|jgi:NAD(P)-dependent dehydrogenase (short-subunit alcohol dehydrogenase family)|nr:SDR family NAD(P)-dependent oxidoreductase [Marinilabiliaceae bacterium]
MKSIVVTGVSSGIGYGTSIELIKKGYHVFGSVRKQEDAQRLKKELGNNFEPLLFDITDQEAIGKEAARVKAIMGNHNLAGLINNAGATEGGPLMHVPVDVLRKNFEVLVSGQLAVTQAFLPLLGAGTTTPGKPGRIIMISSTSGKSGFPFVGPYATAKHALEGLSKSLRAELVLYGIDVIVVGPGNIKTAIWEKNRPETIEQYRNTDYYVPLQNMHQYLKEMVPDDSLDLDVFSRKLVKIFEKKRPRPRYTVVNKPLKNWFILNIIPTGFKNRVVAGKIGLKPNTKI